MFPDPIDTAQSNSQTDALISASERSFLSGVFAEARQQIDSGEQANVDAGDDGDTPAPAVADKPAKATKAKVEEPKEFPDDVLYGKKEDVAAKPEGEQQAKGAEDAEIEIPKGLSPKAGEHFRELNKSWHSKFTAEKAARETAAKELEALKSQAANQKDSEATLKLLEQERQEKQALAAELERVAVERSPQFQQKFTAKEKAIRSQAEAILQEAGVDAKLVDAVLAAKGRQRSSLLLESDLNDVERGQIGALLSNYDMVQAEKHDIISRAHEEHQKWQAEQEVSQRERAMAAKAHEEGVFESTLKELAQSSRMFRKLQGDAPEVVKWNADIDASIQASRKLMMGESSIEEIARDALVAKRAVAMEKMNESLIKQLQAEREKNARISSANPQMKSSGNRPPSGDKFNVSDPDFVRSVFRQAQNGE